MHNNWYCRLFCHVEKSTKGDSPVCGEFIFHFRGLDIKNVEPGPFGLGRSDPFFELAKKDMDHVNGQSNWNVVYRSEHIENNLNPFWSPGKLSLEKLCYGDLAWDMKVIVWDYNDNGKHEKIGEFETKIKELQERISIKGNADRDQAFDLGSGGLKKFRSHGLFVVLEAEVNLVED